MDDNKVFDQKVYVEEESYEKYRNFKSPVVKYLWYMTMGLIPLFGIIYILGWYQKLGLNLYSQQYIGLVLGLILCGTFLSVPVGKHAPRDRVPWYDWILSMLGLSAGLYIVVFYPKIVMEMGTVPTSRFMMSIIAILLILEAVRRVVGKVLLTVVLLFILYGYFAPYLPGILNGSGSSVDQLFSYMYLDSNSLLSLLDIAATVALSFILFGQFLLFFRGADILNDFAISAFGRFRGGPAKGAILGSSLVGTVTGGPVANVILTGSVTIPLMKRNGYSAAQAGAIESVASTGGSIMPPVMGVAAFIIAETLGVPYAQVALAALLPAILYYACLFFQVDFISGRRGMGRLEREKIPSIQEVLKRGWMVLPPLLVLIYLLFFKGYSPQLSGLFASGAAVVFLSFQKPVRQQFFPLLARTFVSTGKTMLDIGVVLSAAGLVVGITSVTGLGFNLGFILSSFAQYGLLVLLIMSALVSLVLGMGMPSVAAYSLVAILITPTLVDLGVNALAAHLFVYYFAIISNFTPPVALACFAASPIARENPNNIAFHAFRLGIVSYLVPFLFVYAPEMLIRTDQSIPWVHTLMSFVTALIGCYLLSMALEGFLFRRLSIMKRFMAAVFAICLFLPTSVLAYSWIINGTAFVAALLFVVLEWLQNRRKNQLPNLESV